MDVRKLDTYNQSYLQGIERSSQFSYSTQYFWWKKYNTLEKIICLILKNANKKIRILDIGCQIGHDIYKLSEKLCKYDIEWYGIDINADFLKVCAMRKVMHTAHKYYFFTASIEKCPVKCDNFDVIICSEVFEHLNSDTVAVNNIHKLLVKNGCLILSTPNIDNRAFVICKFIGKKLIKNIYAAFKTETSKEFAHKINFIENKEEVGHINLKNLDEWKKFINKNHFNINAIKRGAMFYGSKFIDNNPFLFIIITVFDRLFDYCGLFNKWSYNFFIVCRKKI